MLALVLSGGGLFGAWQAGAWSALAGRLQPDLVVGASVWSLNGYLIAGRGEPGRIARTVAGPGLRQVSRPSIEHSIDDGALSMKISYALTVTDILRLKPADLPGWADTWQHIAASCALPGVLPQIRIGGRFYLRWRAAESTSGLGCGGTRSYAGGGAACVAGVAIGLAADDR
jgi:predicted acylesterase/phospholipase RssA